QPNPRRKRMSSNPSVTSASEMQRSDHGPGGGGGRPVGAACNEASVGHGGATVPTTRGRRGSLPFLWSFFPIFFFGQCQRKSGPPDGLGLAPSVLVLLIRR